MILDHFPLSYKIYSMPAIEILNPKAELGFDKKTRIDSKHIRAFPNCLPSAFAYLSCLFVFYVEFTSPTFLDNSGINSTLSQRGNTPLYLHTKHELLGLGGGGTKTYCHYLFIFPHLFTIFLKTRRTCKCKKRSLPDLYSKAIKISPMEFLQ